MQYPIVQSPSSVWQFARKQHGVVEHGQLLALGMHPQAIKRRVASGRLHPVARGVYAVGRPELSRHGAWMAAVLGCGAQTALSHASAAQLWELLPDNRRASIHVALPSAVRRRRPGVTIHRRTLSPADFTRRHNIPVTSPVRTLIDLALVLPTARLEAAINEADIHGYVNPETLRDAIEALEGQPGVAILRGALDRRTFVLTQTELERRFAPIAHRAGLPKPRTQSWVNGLRVDFYWPDLKLVVETDGLRYHRTPAKQTADLRRHQAHSAVGFTPLRFSHAQVAFEAEYVEATLRRVAAILPPRAWSIEGR